MVQSSSMDSRYAPKPAWLKVRAPGGDTTAQLQKTLRGLDLYTVCEEAHCPNMGECWGEGTATIMLLGDVCTRGCRFCAVTTGNPRGAVDVREPEHVARAIARIGLQYVVMTMVDRDDLLDGGAAHVGKTVQKLHALRPDLLLETLVGDFAGVRDNVHTVVDSGPEVFAHNIEVVERLQRTVRDVRCSYTQSLQVLQWAKERAPDRVTKSSIMVGIGETDDEVVATMRDLRTAGVDLLTIGQYLRPSPKHLPVHRYVEPSVFASWVDVGKSLGFAYVASGPLVRSSYKAAEVFVRSILRPGDAAGAEALLAERFAQAQSAAAQVYEGAEVLAQQGSSKPVSAQVIPIAQLVRRA